MRTDKHPDATPRHCTMAAKELCRHPGCLPTENYRQHSQKSDTGQLRCLPHMGRTTQATGNKHPCPTKRIAGETVKRLTPLRLAAQMCREPACKVSQEPLIRRHRLKHAATSAHTRLPQSKRPVAINARVSGHTTHKSLPYGKDQRALKQPISDFIDAFAAA